MRNNLLLGALLCLAVFAAAQSPSPAWRELPAAEFRQQPVINASVYRSLRLSPSLLQSQLSLAPMEGTHSTAAEILLPSPDGNWQRFAVFENTLVPDELKAKYPQLHSYTATGIDDPGAYARLDLTTAGFHAMVLTPRGSWFIDPFAVGNTTDYISYYRTHYTAPASKLQAEVQPTEWRSETQLAVRDAQYKTAGTYMSGPELRTYVAAVSATGEYTQYHGGTIGDGLAAVVTSLNRVAGVYTVEFSITFTLCANNDTLIFTDGATDPFTNTDVGFMIDENQTVCDARIGNGNYDFGHVFGTVGGGLAYLGCICSSGIKAEAATGLNPPVGDPFDIDYVAHEMGHQFDANHTWNYCSGGGEPGHRYEPGSGSTIMGYAGLCGSDDLQSFSHPYFHTHNFDEVVAFSQYGSGNSCALVSATGNSAPIPVVEIDALYLPRSTPFKLTASASDAVGDSLTYSWEGFDDGPSGPVGSPTGTAAIIRSWAATEDSVRIIPRINELVINTAPWGELLPTYARPLNFRVTVRDNKGGVAYMPWGFTVDGASGPFQVTHPNTGGITFAGGEYETITWNVANTDNAPINVDSVNIMMSWDGGFTWPTTLLAKTPNDGSEIITIPDTSCTTCRIIVESHGNVFFDMSNYNFAIDSSAVSVDPTEAIPATIVLYPQPATDQVIADITQPHPGDVTLTLINSLGQTLRIQTLNHAGQQFRTTWSLQDLPAGIYWLNVKTTTSTTTQKLVILK